MSGDASGKILEWVNHNHLRILHRMNPRARRRRLLLSRRLLRTHFTSSFLGQRDYVSAGGCFYTRPWSQQCTWHWARRFITYPTWEFGA